jgi:Uncharacterized protein conserved in bacteria (DUF2332)
VPVGRARSLAQVYRHFGEVDAAEASPVYERVAVALSESEEALRAIEAAPPRKRHPTVILAALHDLAAARRVGTNAVGLVGDARWLRACLWPDQPERVARLEAEIALAATAPPLLLQLTPSRCCPTPSPVCPRTPCLSSPRRGRSRASRSKVACASCTASTKRRRAGQ